MSNTPTTVPVKSKLSNSLKERLKRCGRYHASPEPVARQPKISLATPVQTKTQNDSTVSDMPVSPCTKRQCIDRSPDGDVTYGSSLKSPMATGTQAHKTPILTCIEPNKSNILDLEKSEDDKIISKNLTDICSLNQTPLSERSRLCFSSVRGSKLKFEDVIDENTHERQKTEEVTSLCSDNQTTNQRGKCNLVEQKIDLSESMSRPDLLKELGAKEEQLRKLRMVKMYRSKNNLEELQTLIDKWRNVSQQALQDLYVSMPEPRPSLTDLINHLGIDHQLVHFSAEDDETFF